MKRKSRQNSIHERGIEQYDFDFSKEIAIYKFLCAETLTKKQKKLLLETEKFNTYEAWKNFIEDKYSNYPIEGLKEFSRYLSHQARKTTPTRELSSSFISAMFSCILTFFITKLYSEIFDYTVFVTIFLFFIIALAYCLTIPKLIVMSSELFFDNSIKEALYKDYKEIIDSIVKAKENV